MRSKCFTFLSGVFLALLLSYVLPTSASAALVSIAWEDAKDANIIGFRVYAGPNLGSLQRVDDVTIGELGQNAAGDWIYTVDVSDTEVVYLVLTAYGAAGSESGYSNPKVYNDDDRDGVANVDDAFPDDPSRWDPPGTTPPSTDPPSTDPPDTTPPPSGGGGTDTYRLNVGGPNYEDSAGNAWVSDAAYVNVGSVVNRFNTVEGTNDQTLYKTGRWDGTADAEMRFTIPVTPGTYTVKLHFCEQWGSVSAPGTRVFAVSIQGSQVLSNFDVFAEAGFGTVLVKEFLIDVGTGPLSIELQHVVQNPEIYAIEVLPGDQMSSPPSGPSPPGRPTIIQP